ncbi:MAG TPA: PrsW family glutamic-type intramembrane protease [Phototrophicaceae bacterium]|nr:PrsW family glutamic-type intramembrane protease [Phototrophicaceae bacterium]
MATFNSRLLVPPGEEAEIPPYRSVWRSIIIEYGVLSTVTVGLFALINFISFTIPEAVRIPLNIGIVLLPVGLWVIFSLLPERRVPLPRNRLIAVGIVSGLVAKAIGYPFVHEVLQVDEWLSLATAIQRIIGFTFTVGIVQETLKYVVVRSLIWSDQIRIRDDSIAYADASALGYATILNLHFALTGSPSPDAVAASVLSTLVIHLVATAIVSYGLVESRLTDTSPLALPISLALAALIPGAAIPLHAGLTNASISLKSLAFTLPRPLFGIAFSLVVLIAGLLTVAFFINTAERQAREKRVVEE